MKKQYDIAAFIWPAYTGDEPRARIFWPEGYGEWQTVKAAGPKYPGHQWPRKPLWGYCNDADPYVMEMQINAAADHGVNVFIYDWYWYDGQPFLEQCLDNGFLGAKNNDRMKFYLMWANHDAMSLWDKRTAEQNNMIWSGKQDETQWNIICDRIIEKYFSHPSYYKIDGKPVFMIYDVVNMIEGLGGMENARRCVEQFRAKVVAAGHPGLELQLMQMGEAIFNVTGVDGNAGKISTTEVLQGLGFDSLTNYQFVSAVGNMDRDYAEIIVDAEKKWQEYTDRYDIPYYPHISLGWDNNPRFTSFRPGVVKNNTPAAVEEGFRRIKAFVDAHEQPVPLITVNSWNEWTEASYLQPDDLNGYGYLEAIKKVFVDENE